MGDTQKVIEGIQQIAGTNRLKNKPDLYYAEVISVDKDKRTCTCSLVSGTSDIEIEVKLMSEVQDGLLLIPAEGSTILIATTPNTVAYVVMYSKIDEVIIVTGNQLISMKNNSIVFNSEGYGGIPIVKDPGDSNAGLKKRLNLIENDTNQLKSLINSLVTGAAAILTSAVGTQDAFALAFATAFSSYATNNLSPTTEVQISNPSIKHGKEVTI